ncbi:hypothetical protein [Lewinella sp. JB7]|uniref:hypothetical protein n=1 Tax=Lewinella sp. JB7 TaxID=2962887 RepID=UPI0020C9A15B|nr:hypothetical protein [Lewinella sp. JB7]MCP9235797.1 hypothetical protein [Lewinella sp. JB7]
MVVWLQYISLIAGGLLVLLLLAGIVGGVDADVDIDAEGGAEGGSGFGFGIVKGGLTFLSVGAWVAKLLLLASTHPVAAIVSGVGAGAVAVYLMSLLVKWILGYEENVNWSVEDTLLQSGRVYLRIPAAGEGIVHVTVKGAVRELKARSSSGTEIPTGANVYVEDYTAEGTLLVSDSDAATNLALPPTSP